MTIHIGSYVLTWLWTCCHNLSEIANYGHTVDEPPLWHSGRAASKYQAQDEDDESENDLRR